MRSVLLVAGCWALAQASYGQYTALPAPASDVVVDSATTKERARTLPDLRNAMLGDATQLNGPAASGAATPPPVFRALFCRMDDDLDAKKIPLRVRAGEIDAINRMERKPGY